MATWEDYKKTMRQENPIFAHARNGDVENLKFELTPSNLNIEDSKGYSPLMLAAYHGKIEATRMLIERGANVNLTDHSGNSILMGAAFKGHLEITKLLIEAGAEVDALNPRGQTARDFAQMFGRTEVVLYLNSIMNKPEVFTLKDRLSSWTSYIFSKRRA